MTALSTAHDCHLQWDADSVTDMYADAVLSVIFQVTANPHSLQGVCVGGEVMCDVSMG